MPEPACGTERRTSLGGERRPQSEVLEDAPDDPRILDQRNDPHRSLAPGALQRIGLVDFADQPRPSGFRVRKSDSSQAPFESRLAGSSRSGRLRFSDPAAALLTVAGPARGRREERPGNVWSVTHCRQHATTNCHATHLWRPRPPIVRLRKVRRTDQSTRYARTALTSNQAARMKVTTGGVPRATAGCWCGAFPRSSCYSDCMGYLCTFAAQAHVVPFFPLQSSRDTGMALWNHGAPVTSVLEWSVRRVE
jgi:hypothetical protein